MGRLNWPEKTKRKGLTVRSICAVTTNNNLVARMWNLSPRGVVVLIGRYLHVGIYCEKTTPRVFGLVVMKASNSWGTVYFGTMYL